MSGIDTLKDLIRPFVNRLSATRRVQVVAHRATYLGRFHEWTRAHPCPEFQPRQALYEHVEKTQVRGQPITYLEFGVYRGDTVRWWVEHHANPQSIFVGFDSFEGLPEQWGAMPVGTFSTNGNIPQIDDTRVRFEKGWFNNTVPPYLAKHPPRGRIVAHLDADLYSSTLLALMSLAPHLKPGDILVFDEWADYMDEFRAFESVAQAYALKYVALGHTPSWTQVALQLV